MIFSRRFLKLLIIHYFLTNKNHSIGNAVYSGEVVDETTHREFKYMVSILKYGDPRCAGTIIDQRHILSAAHCFTNIKAYDVSVIAGVIELDDEFGVIREVKRIHRHPDFVKAKATTPISYCFYSTCRGFYGPPDVKKIPENDIAVLTLHDPLPVTATIGPVSLPSNDYLPFECKPCHLAGWGATKTRRRGTYTLNWTQLVILPPEKCKDRSMQHRENEFCAQDYYQESCPLKGDSGAPLVCDGIVVGITSAGQCNPNYPTIFVNVFDHRKFIYDALDD